VSGGPDIDAMCERYGPMVLRRCRRLLRDEQEARDVAQEVFVRFIVHSRRRRPEYPSSLLYRIATNLCLNRIRDRRREPAGDEAPLYRIAGADHAESGAARLLLDRLFGRHPESTRTMAVLHYLDGLTLDEVAEATGLSVSGVRKRLRRLRDTLKEFDR
jgi:RNA polymerase sigma-70 factor (ECF subfamily)